MTFFDKHPNRLRILIAPILAALAVIYGYNQLSSSEPHQQTDSGTSSYDKPPEKGIISVDHTIHLEELYKKSLSFKLLQDKESELTIWYHDGTGLSLNQFDRSGKHINTISLPTIDEPIGINRISDFFVYNSDSIFVYDGQYRKMLLVNSASEVLNLWLINNYVPSLSASRNNEIVDIYKNPKGELKIDLTGFDNTYYQSDPNFARYNSFVYQINLDTKQVNRGLSYPENSVYRDYLFWSGAIPYVRKTPTGYMATFPLDEQIYTYSQDLTPTRQVSSEPENFPRAIGNQYGSQQQMNFARIDRKLNGFNLKTRGIFETKNKHRFAKVYRAPLGDDDAIPDDYATFLQGDYRSKHYLQVFDVSKKGALTKHYHDIEISRMGLGNLLHIDKNEHYYFLKNDPDSEERVIVVCSISTQDGNVSTLAEVLTDIP